MGGRSCGAGGRGRGRADLRGPEEKGRFCEDADSGQRVGEGLGGRATHARVAPRCPEAPGGGAGLPGAMPPFLAAPHTCQHCVTAVTAVTAPPSVSLFLTFPVPPSLSRATLSSLHLCHFPLGGAWPLRSQAGRSRPGPALPGSRLSLSPLLPLLSSAVLSGPLRSLWFSVSPHLPLSLPFRACFVPLRSVPACVSGSQSLSPSVPLSLYVSFSLPCPTRRGCPTHLRDCDASPSPRTPHSTPLHTQTPPRPRTFTLSSLGQDEALP